jgi:hypothetical protein
LLESDEEGCVETPGDADDEVEGLADGDQTWDLKKKAHRSN